MDAIPYLCERLAERRATLFLGAGINYGVSNEAGVTFPLGADLAKSICAKLLDDADLGMTLDEAAEFARARVGASSLNRFIFDLMETYQPQQVHRNILTLPWDTIFTTNYDLLVERASNQIDAASKLGNLLPITSTLTDLSALRDIDTPYYKLHGSIDVANTPEGRLILTKSDYRYYLDHRVPLFRRLAEHLGARTFVFAGYGRQDSNFREILEDCRRAIGTANLPRSFALRPGVRPAEVSFWKDQYNIEVINATAEDFFASLKESWDAERRSIMTPTELAKIDFLDVDSTATLPRAGDCYYALDASRVQAKSNAKAFFCGGEPSWGDIRARIAPGRDGYWELFEAIFDELNDPLQPTAMYLLTGAAGTGKTTALRTLAWTLADEFKFPVLVHRSGTPLDFADAISRLPPDPRHRGIVVVQHAAEHIRELRELIDVTKRKGRALTVIAEERSNQWKSAPRVDQLRGVTEVELGGMSDREIEDILGALSDHGCLGRLEPLDYSDQVAHFQGIAHKELLVALRELTAGSTRFDEIIRDEYFSVPSTLAKQAYTLVCAVGQADLFVRYETLLRLLHLTLDDFRELVNPTHGILLSTEISGRSRHTVGYRLRARHPVIASVVFAAAAPTDAEKLGILKDIIDALDPGFHEDRTLLEAIVRRREIAKTLASPEMRRELYDGLAKALPNNPHVLMHRSILERESGRYEAAVEYARAANKLAPDSNSARTSLGFALAERARSEPVGVVRTSLLVEAERVFSQSIRTNLADPFGHLGMVKIKRIRRDSAANDAERDVLAAEILTSLEDAREKTNGDPAIEQEIAAEQAQVGERSQAIETLRKALVARPGNERLGALLATYLLDDDKADEAFAVAAKSAVSSPSSWRLWRLQARIGRQLGHDKQAIKDRYSAAIRNNAGDADLHVEYAAWLFMTGEYDDAVVAFKAADALPLNHGDRSRIRVRWRDGTAARTFRGRVARIVAAGGFLLALPENFEVFFWRHSGLAGRLAAGDEVDFEVGFACRGARGHVLRVLKSVVR